MHSNNKLLGTLWAWEETRHCSGTDNKHFITQVSMHIAIIALDRGLHFHSSMAREIPRPLMQ